MKTVLVTGANSGIGLATTKRLLKVGYKVVALSKHSNELEQINSNNLIIYTVDLMDTSKLKAFLQELDKKNISIDILINNAGIGIFKNIDNFKTSEWNEIITLNLSVPFILINHFVPAMKKKKYGRIINIGSDADHVPFKQASVYCASKYGLLGLTEALRLELKEFNIQITTISPARVDTKFNKKNEGDRPLSLKADDIAIQIEYILSMPNRCMIEQIKLSSIYE